MATVSLPPFSLRFLARAAFLFASNLSIYSGVNDAALLEVADPAIATHFN
jgi:hypothetical protein